MLLRGEPPELHPSTSGRHQSSHTRLASPGPHLSLRLRLAFPWGASVMPHLSCLPGVRSLSTRLERWQLHDGYAGGSQTGFKAAHLDVSLSQGLCLVESSQSLVLPALVGRSQSILDINVFFFFIVFEGGLLVKI